LSKNIRVLVVDDDKTIQTTMKAILEDEGYTVDLASTGQEAINKTQATAYNIALLDIRLPDMDGVELLKRLKDPVPKTRKIMVTGFPSTQNAVAAVNGQADAYIIKPVDIEKLLETIRAQLKLQEEERQFSEKKVAEFIESRISDLKI
jgi:DNA-binding response OmpR family regulator